MTKGTNLCSNPQNDIDYLLWCILKTWQRGKQKILDEYGVTASQLEVMGAIYACSEDKKEITQVVLSQETNIDPMTISTIIRNLQKKGLIDRTESLTDTRARLVTFTCKGRDLFIKALSKVKEEQEILFEGIDQDALKEQLCILLDIINKKKVINKN